MGDAVVHVVGPNKLQNELLIPFLEGETGLKCISSQDLDHAEIQKGQGVQHVVLFDSQGMDRDNPWAKIDSITDSAIPNCSLALFNFDPDIGVEGEAIDHGVRGIFYANEPMKILPKGIHAILKGEMWYSRETLSRCLTENRIPAKLSGTEAGLTMREKDILIGIASGMSNQEIADKFFISSNTVKTHIYNVYKKIEVTNRLQAALWAAKYL